MEVCWRSSWLLLLLGVSLLATTLQGVQGEVELEGPSESECRPYIEKALKELETGDTAGDAGAPDSREDSKEDIPTVEITTDDSDHQDGDGDDDTHEANESNESIEAEQNVTGEDHSEQEDAQQDASQEAAGQDKSGEDTEKSKEDDDDADGADSKEKASAEDDDNKSDGQDDGDDTTEENKSAEAGTDDQKSAEDNDNDTKEDDNDTKEDDNDTKEESAEAENVATLDAQQSEEDKNDTTEDSKEDDKDSKDSKEDDDKTNSEEDDGKSAEAATKSAEDDDDSKQNKDDSGEKSGEAKDDDDDDDKKSDEKSDDKDSKEDVAKSDEDKKDSKEDTDVDDDDDDHSKPASDEEDGEPEPVEALGMDEEMPSELRDRSHVEHLLKLDEEASETEAIINRVAEITLRELKKLYENAIKPLEVLYKYRDLSNRHFGDAEIFSKPLILFMGPWSGGKSSIINYLLNNEYNETSIRTGAEPSPAYFNIMMHGEEAEVLDGTTLAADYTFSGLQKFGQGLEERLRGIRLPSELLERVNIVEIPGILEVRKQVSRVFPFNDACQWFIDRADIIFLVYDPSKLDVGPETEAILDQLKGREHQTRIVLNKADQVKPEELMRVQGALIWNISPLMSSAQPPLMYTTSLWSRPYEPWAPVRLLQAQERAFLRDLRSAVDKRIENKIASARRFAVRVRNHAKMVDCYLTTYYNHKSLFGNRKMVADEIAEHPQDYHIYEGLSTLTNISRYDLPDPDVYRDFFKLNPLYEFQQLSATCTYFRGCPINRLDIAIAYDLPELVGKHKKLVEAALSEANKEPVPGS